ncbi:MAG: polysaccharide biosynthesis tyrosine autokinase [Desulfuromonadales bacterium]|nr:polysaccharide biosynthesis tyrosine autokinase [Desulfuromonadales bacterium]
MMSQPEAKQENAWSGDDGVPLRLLGTLRRRWRLVGLCVVLALLGGVLTLFLAPPVYRAQTVLAVTPDPESDSDAAGIEKLLASRRLAEQALRRLNLDWQVIEQSPDLQAVISRFAVSGGLPGLMIRIDDAQSYRVYDLAGRFLGDGRSRQPFVSEGVDLLLELEAARAGQQLVLEYRPVASAALALLDTVQVVADPQQRLLTVTVTGTDALQVRDLANLLVEELRAELAMRHGEQLADLQRQLQQARQTLATLQEEQGRAGLLAMTGQAVPPAADLARLEQQRAELTALRDRIRSAAGRLAVAVRDGAEFIPPDLDASSPLRSMTARLDQLQADRRQLLIDYTEAHPQVLQVDEALTVTRSELLTAFRSYERQLTSQIDMVSRQLQEATAGLAEQSPARQAELRQRWQIATDRLAALQRQEDKLRAGAARLANRIKVIDPAVTPRTPLWPDPPRLLALSAGCGLLGGVLLALLLGAVDRRFNSIEQIREGLRLPIFGVIPKIPETVPARGVPVAVQSPKAPVVEAFRALRTRLHVATGKQPHQVILVTSSLPGEGKSTVSTNLAVVLGMTGARVLLIGCDLRRPTLHSMFGQSNEPGLVELLTGESRDAIRHLASPRLDFLPAGRIPENPAELLGSARMRQLLDTVRSRYDYVLIDAPPVLPVTDAQILSPLTDLTLVVVEPCRVPQAAARQMVAALRDVGAVIDGVVVNDRTGRGFRFHGSYSYYGNRNYSGYYGESADDLAESRLRRSTRALWDKLNG